MRLEHRFLVLTWGLLLPVAAYAQPQGIDERVLHRVNRADGAPVRLVLGAADWSAYPVFVGALPAVWAPVIFGDRDNDAAIRMSASMVGAYAIAAALKRLKGRQRPYAVHDWVLQRSRYPGGRGLDTRHSWPSGHATLASAIATTVLLSKSGPEIGVPVTLWATSVGLSRVWLGVHYPSDVMSGWVLGAGVALIVHQIRNNTSSDSFEGSPLFRLAIPIE